MSTAHEESVLSRVPIGTSICVSLRIEEEETIVDDDEVIVVDDNDYCSISLFLSFFL